MRCIPFGPQANREAMLLTKLEQQGERYKEDGPMLLELAEYYDKARSWGQVGLFSLQL